MAHPIKHFITITKHRHRVMLHCFKAGIPFQGLTHDLSKYSPTEFIPGAKYYLGNRSPNEAERIEKGYSAAWLHHKGRNRHHYEYWMDYSTKTKRLEPIEMPTKYLKEMFCDRVAASKIYQGKNYTEAHPLEYFFPRENKDYKCTRKQHKSLSGCLWCWKKREKGTFAYIRKMK